MFKFLKFFVTLFALALCCHGSESSSVGPKLIKLRFSEKPCTLSPEIEITVCMEDQNLIALFTKVPMSLTIREFCNEAAKKLNIGFPRIITISDQEATDTVLDEILLDYFWGCYAAELCFKD